MTQANTQATTPGVVRLVGRVDSSRSAGKAGAVRTLLVLPASDSFSHPATVEIRSKQRLGSTGQEVEVVCKVVGFKNRPRTNPETGEVYPPSAQVVLEALAA